MCPVDDGDWVLARELQQENKRLEGLLALAICPDCDGSGVNTRGQVGENEWDIEQCQWCAERKQALKGGE